MYISLHQILVCYLRFARLLQQNELCLINSKSLIAYLSWRNFKSPVAAKGTSEHLSHRSRLVFSTIRKKTAVNDILQKITTVRIATYMPVHTGMMELCAKIAPIVGFP